jgi:hypothetical protein
LERWTHHRRLARLVLRRIFLAVAADVLLALKLSRLRKVTVQALRCTLRNSRFLLDALERVAELP